MCVIITGSAAKILPLVDDAVTANACGVGLAWVQPDSRLAFRKGITSERRVKRILRAIGTGTAVFHARIATSGGTHALLTHPFRVERGSPVHYAGRDADFLLFHNGISSLDWRAHVPTKSGLYWSDTRTLAHALATGAATLDDLRRDGGRWLLFYHARGGAWIQRIGQWSTSPKYPGLFFSNLAFLYDWTAYLRERSQAARVSSYHRGHWYDDSDMPDGWSGSLFSCWRLHTRAGERAPLS